MSKTKYFFNVQTAEELKKLYKEYVKKLHPDNGGNEEEFKNMKAEFESLFNVVKNTHYNKDGDVYEATGDYATTETAAEFMDIIEKLIFIEDIDLELCGSWLWISGNTKEYKDLLKELGCRYSANKKMWYYQKSGKRKWHKKAWTIDEIRTTYGSQLIDKEPQKRLEA